MQRAGMWVKVTALLAILAVGCGGDGTQQPPPPPAGTLALTFAPALPSVPSLTLSQVQVHVEHVAVFGDVAPDSRTTWSGTSLDFTGPVSHTFDQAPQGLYSRVRFVLEQVSFQGTYAGHGVIAQLELEESQAIVDLRDPTGQEVGPGSSASFGVALDATQWFAGVDLSQALLDGNGNIVLDYSHNLTLAEKIAENALGAFTLQPSTSGPH